MVSCVSNPLLRLNTATVFPHVTARALAVSETASGARGARALPSAAGRAVAPRPPPSEICSRATTQPAFAHGMSRFVANDTLTNLSFFPSPFAIASSRPSNVTSPRDSGATCADSTRPDATSTPSSTSCPRPSNSYAQVNANRFHNLNPIPRSPFPVPRSTTRLRWTCPTSISFGVTSASGPTTPFWQIGPLCGLS